VVFVLVGLVLFLGDISRGGEVYQSGTVKLTPFSMDFFGYIDGVVKGDTLMVFDPDGILCGKFTVQKDGQYGFLHVYGDDPSTRVDEGAERGDTLAFRLNGEPLFPSSPEDALWLGIRQRKQLDFTRP